MNKLVLARHIVEAARLAVELRQHIASRQTRRAVCEEVHCKQFEDLEQRLEKVLTPIFRAQVREARERLASASMSNNAEALASRIFDPEEWTERIIDAAFPVLARAMGEAAVAQWLLMGATDPRKSHKTTATEWLEENDAELPPGISTEWPQWMIDAIEIQLQETFRQDFWQRLSVTTRDDIELFLRNGLTEGWSIEQMAREMNRHFPNEYSVARGRNIARTESGHALNAGRDLSIRQMKEELGEAGQFIGKSWLSVLGNTTRETHADLDGEMADEDGMFNLSGYTVPWPGHVSLPPAERCNCQCTIETVFGAGAPEDEIQALMENL